MVLKKIYLSGDHAGFELKEGIELFLKKLGYIFEDFGPLEYNKEDDYPDFVIPMARAVSKDKDSRGIITAGSGQGEAIAVNKIKGIRAGLYYGGNLKIVNAGRTHNNINIICMGARFVKEIEAKKAIKLFLTTKFEKGCHERRLMKVKEMTRK